MGVLLVADDPNLINSGLLVLNFLLNSFFAFADFINFFKVVVSQHRKLLDLFTVLVFVVGGKLENASFGVRQLFENFTNLVEGKLKLEDLGHQ